MKRHPNFTPFTTTLKLLGKTPRACTFTTQEDTLTSGSRLTFYAPSSYTTFGPRDAVSTSTIATPLTKFSRKPGWPPSKSAWPPGRPSGPLGRSMTLLCKLGLSSPLDLNGFIWTSLGVIALPSGGASSRLCTSLIFLMIEGAVASLPRKGVHPQTTGDETAAIG